VLQQKIEIYTTGEKFIFQLTYDVDEYTMDYVSKYTNIEFIKIYILSRVSINI